MNEMYDHQFGIKQGLAPFNSPTPPLACLPVVVKLQIIYVRATTISIQYTSDINKHFNPTMLEVSDAVLAVFGYSPAWALKALLSCVATAKRGWNS